jgi:hypothetical protein
VALVRTDILGEHITSDIMVTRFGKQGTLAATSNQGMLILVTLMMQAIYSSGSSVLTRATWHHTPEDSILQTKQN